MQTVGLEYTSPSSSAFITGLYVAMTPVVESIVRRRAPPWEVCVAIVVATGGLFMLTGADLNFGKGELFTLACAALFAVWIVALLCVPAVGVQGTGNFTGIAIFAAAFTGIACSSVALSLQLYGQKRIAPSRAALILLSEPVFAGIAGYVDGERLSALQLGGAAVILIGISIAELAPGRARAEAEDAQVEADLEARLR